jgi:hypothetical protein
MSVVIAVSLLAGCSGESGESTARPEKPQAGLDAVKKLQGSLPDPKAGAKDKFTSPAVKSSSLVRVASDVRDDERDPGQAKVRPGGRGCGRVVSPGRHRPIHGLNPVGPERSLRLWIRAAGE